MSADRLTVYRLLAVDIDVLNVVATRLSTGAVSEAEQQRLSREVTLLIGRARDNPYTEP